MIISLVAEKALEKTQYAFMIKVMERLGIQWSSLNIIKAISVLTVFQLLERKHTYILYCSL